MVDDGSGQGSNFSESDSSSSPQGIPLVTIEIPSVKISREQDYLGSRWIFILIYTFYF